jgi:hypothetical protein
LISLNINYIISIMAQEKLCDPEAEWPPLLDLAELRRLQAADPDFGMDTPEADSPASPERPAPAMSDQTPQPDSQE